MSEEEKKGPEAAQSSKEQEEATASSESIAEEMAPPAEEAAQSKAAEEASSAAKPDAEAAAQSIEPAESEPKPAPSPADAEREAKLKAAAEARAARAAAKAKAEAEAAEAAQAEQDTPKEPSPRQGDLDRYVRLIEETIGVGTVQESGLNELNADMPMLVIAAERWPETGLLLRDNGELGFNYLRNVSGIDYETHLEVVYFLLSLDTGQDVAIKLKADREAPSVPSATPIWSTANWNEREIYDLLGIRFVGHPDLRRIMMPDDWVGHPLRKDYEPLDSEV
ncbi:NADH-quinone oxidoreductase subunit C [Paenibacillus pinisoli]|nr:NADH-quinone oxidoreductase subunit C [Paenibacillus pinisoli]